MGSIRVDAGRQGGSAFFQSREDAIIEASCTVVGTARVVDVQGPLSAQALREAAEQGRLGLDEAEAMDYPDTYAWVLEDVTRFPEPVPYQHPRGAITWVRLDRAPSTTTKAQPSKPRGPRR